jgi:hypothetical protein
MTRQGILKLEISKWKYIPEISKEVLIRSLNLRSHPGKSAGIHVNLQPWLMLTCISLMGHKRGFS